MKVQDPLYSEAVEKEALHSTAQHTWTHVAGVPGSRFNCAGERKDPGQVPALRRMQRTGMRGYRLSLACLNVTWAQSGEGRKGNLCRDQPYHTRAPVTWGGAHSLFVGMLRHQETVKFENLTTRQLFSAS